MGAASSGADRAIEWARHHPVRLAHGTVTAADEVKQKRKRWKMTAGIVRTGAADESTHGGMEKERKTMRRQVSLEEISDGRLYSRNDMVKAGCGGCKGCSSCCRGMGESVILDPFDVFRLTVGTEKGFEELLNGKLELNVVDGIILPNLNMSGKEEACGFLDENGRCSVHAYRPGICRMFPLGRYYETDASGERTFRYFLQVDECPVPNKTKVKVAKWIDTPDLVQYERFVKEWHYFLEDVEDRIAQEKEEQAIKNINLFLLKLFYMKPYKKDGGFYTEFGDRMMQAREVLEMQQLNRYVPKADV